jgi:hypothetical protein
MLSLITVPIGEVKDGSYRDTWRVGDKEMPTAAQAILQNLQDIVSAGDPLHIQVAKIDGEYVVLDGHFCLDAYRNMGRKVVLVILNDRIQDIASARAAYIGFNYLRSPGWLRDSIKTREELVRLGAGEAVKRMADPDLARDLINRDDERWKKFSSVGKQEDEPFWK